MFKITKIQEVVDWRLCVGCGGCAYICPEQRIQLLDFQSEGIRPVANDRHCGTCQQCLDVCPAIQSDYESSEGQCSGATETGLVKDWGPIVAMWEGYALDPEIRFKGSSGGALTAISAYCIERLGMHGVLHISQDPEHPIRNRTVLSRTVRELIAATGSRYSPASVCGGLGLVEAAPAPCVVIGKPAEIAAIKNARRLRPELNRKVGVTLSFLCAETPSTEGTLALLKHLGLDSAKLRDLRYRGNGWPGDFAPTLEGEKTPRTRMSYRDSWGFLQAFRPWSVQLWPDGSGELADICCGDPWYESPNGSNPGISLVIARTTRGREIVEGAAAAGYLTLKPAEYWKLSKSQWGLLEKKRAVWGRRLALRIFGLPTTHFSGLDLFHCWKQLSFSAKLRATLGTIRRIIGRKLYRPLRLNPLEGTPQSLTAPKSVSSPLP